MNPFGVKKVRALERRKKMKSRLTLSSDSLIQIIGPNSRTNMSPIDFVSMVELKYCPIIDRARRYRKNGLCYVEEKITPILDVFLGMDEQLLYIASIR